MYACACNDKLIRQSYDEKLTNFPRRSWKTQQNRRKPNARDDLIENIWRWNFEFSSLSFAFVLCFHRLLFVVHSSLHNCHWLTFRRVVVESSHPEAQKQQQRRDLLSECLWFKNVFLVFECLEVAVCLWLSSSSTSTAPDIFSLNIENTWNSTCAWRIAYQNSQGVSSTCWTPTHVANETEIYAWLDFCRQHNLYQPSLKFESQNYWWCELITC